MSAVDTVAAPAGPAAGTGVVAPPVFSTRFFRSELLLIFGRRRNWVGLAVLAVVPILLTIAGKVNPPGAGGCGDEAGSFVNQITNTGLFVALVSLLFEMPLFLPIAVAAISGDAIAGEANLGTLRYVLSVLVDRTRLLAVKLGAQV